MDSLMETYDRVHLQIECFQEKIADCQDQILRIDNRRNGEIPARITNLKDHLKKIDEYQLKIDGFLKLAEKHMTSRNVLTIEAPPGYRVNLNRLKTWSMMIDPMSEDDPYAQRVYLVSKCDLHFLNQKKEEFTDRIAQLEQDLAAGSTDEIKELNDKIQSLKEELAEYIAGEEVKAFAAYVCSENEKNIYTECPAAFSGSSVAPAYWVPGACGFPLNVEEEQRKILKRMMGDFYDDRAGRVYLPMERISSDAEFAMTVSCVPARKRVNEMDAGIRNLIFNEIDKSPAGKKKVCVIDAMRQNSSLIGSLKQVEGCFALRAVPRNQEQIQTALEELVSSFNDIDDILENYDTVCEYNQHAEEEKQIARSLVVLVGWPDAFDRECGNYLKRILTNYERYGISLVMVRVSAKTDKEENFGLSEYAGENIIHVSMSARETTVSVGTEPSYAFSWYSFRHGVNDGYVNSLTAHNFKKNTLGTEYTRRIDMSRIPGYTRGKKDIVVPYGVDSKDQVHEMMFGNENFAAYLMGASGSGKSTLLHTVITGIIRNYHPDDVELWLADFKMSEFAQYIDPLPPHVKYILLDESQELVYDLIDRLTEKMMERQRFFMQHRDMKKVENVPSNIYMPVIFVILDEFSIMSQSVAESEIYKLKLQNLLAKGRALGIKFIFSSQTFIRGVGGLTQTAKDQIQMRIAMKNSYEEIDKTLELSSNVRTEQVKNWMDALPPHYALSKYRDGDHMSVKRLQVMYFAGSGEAALEPQRNLIRQLNNTMRAVSNYEYNSTGTYVGKNPVVVDGNTFDAFDGEALADYVRAVKESGTDGLAEDEMLLSFGTPRLMVKMKPAVLSSETRENILLIARSAEQACAASILLAAMKSYQLQNGKVQIWTYGKNRLYLAYRQVFLAQGFEIIEGMDAVCDAIRRLKQCLTDKEASNTLITMIGIDRICMDFDFVDGAEPGKKAESSMEEKRKEFERKGAVVSTDQAEEKRQYAMKWMRYKRPIVKKAESEGKTPEEMKQILQEAERQFRLEQGYEPEEETVPEVQNVRAEEPAQPAAGEEKETSGAYNAADDFLYVVKQGSRLGYHFCMALNSFADIKQTGLKPDFFRHKLSFQISVDDSRSLFGNKSASALPEHICQYDDSLEHYSFRPYLHRGVTWEDWDVDEDGKVVSPQSIG